MAEFPKGASCCREANAFVLCSVVSAARQSHSKTDAVRWKLLSAATESLSAAREERSEWRAVRSRCHNGRKTAHWLLYKSQNTCTVAFLCMSLGSSIGLTVDRVDGRGNNRGIRCVSRRKTFACGGATLLRCISKSSRIFIARKHHGGLVDVAICTACHQCVVFADKLLRPRVRLSELTTLSGRTLSQVMGTRSALAFDTSEDLASLGFSSLDIRQRRLAMGTTDRLKKPLREVTYDCSEAAEWCHR